MTLAAEAEPTETAPAEEGVELPKNLRPKKPATEEAATEKAPEDKQS